MLPFLFKHINLTKPTTQKNTERSASCGFCMLCVCEPNTNRYKQKQFEVVTGFRFVFFSSTASIVVIYSAANLTRLTEPACAWGDWKRHWPISHVNSSQPQFAVALTQRRRWGWLVPGTCALTRAREPREGGGGGGWWSSHNGGSNNLW